MDILEETTEYNNRVACCGQDWDYFDTAMMQSFQRGEWEWTVHIENQL